MGAAAFTKLDHLVRQRSRLLMSQSTMPPSPTSAVATRAGEGQKAHPPEPLVRWVVARVPPGSGLLSRYHVHAVLKPQTYPSYSRDEGVSAWYCIASRMQLAQNALPNGARSGGNSCENMVYMLSALSPATPVRAIQNLSGCRAS